MEHFTPAFINAKNCDGLFKYKRHLFVCFGEELKVTSAELLQRSQDRSRKTDLSY
jgi:hypothetical protein